MYTNEHTIICCLCLALSPYKPPLSSSTLLIHRRPWFGGPGGALMPRKKQERMDQEKKKRLNAQNGRDSKEWKSEAEMVLRQQYD